MDSVLLSLTQHLSTTLLVLSVGLLTATLISLFVLLRLRSYQNQWRGLFAQASGDELESLLKRHFEDRIVTDSAIRSIEERLDKAEQVLRSSKRFLGLVRFDAFPDVGGSQSFALALFDDNGDGAVLSSIIGRNSCRVYCKPIVGGRSERDLSQEEQRAMRSATEGGVRLILSP